MKKILSSGETTNVQLMDLAKKYGVKLEAIVFKDQLLRLIPKEGSYVLNLQDSTAGNGTHWIGLFLAPKGQMEHPEAYFFDSYGVPPPESVLYFARQYGAKFVYYSNDQIQRLNQDYCGQYVISWLYHMQHETGPYDVRFGKFLRQFHSIRKI